MKNLFGTLTLLAALAVPAIASAQDDDPFGGLGTGGGSTPAPTPAPMSSQSYSSAPSGNRPEAKSLGLGAGWTFPQDLQIPNTVSARFRWTDVLTFEPAVTLGIARSSTKTEVGGASTETTVGTTTAEVGTLVRYSYAQRGPIDLIVLGGAGLGFGSTKTDPDGADNSVTVTSTAFSMVYGLGLEWFFKEHLSASFDALNPILGYANTKTEDSAADSETTDNTLTFAATWDPTIRLMFHLYY